MSILFSIAYSLFYKFCRRRYGFRRPAYISDGISAYDQDHFNTRIHFAAKMFTIAHFPTLPCLKS
jgi:hypothetical protein